MPKLDAKNKRQATHFSTRRCPMTAAILPFPIARRRAFISKQAAHAALMHPEAGVRYLQHQLDVQAEAMRRKGV
jgi:hypothetical protein